MTTAEKKQTKGRNRTIEQKNVFSDGVLILFRTRCWGATTRADDNVIQISEDYLPKDKEAAAKVRKMIRAQMDLLDDKTLLEQLNQIRSEAKRYIHRNSIPFPAPNMVFVPKNRIVDIDERLQRYQQEWEEVAEDLVEQLDSLKEKFKAKYPELYDEASYPSKASLRSRIYFNWSFRQFTVPDREMSVLSPEIYKREVAKFKQDIAEMKSMTLNVMANEFIQRIEALKKGCETGNITPQTVTAINGFLSRFDDVWDGFIEEKKIRKLVQEIKDYMDGTDAGMIRYDDNFRQIVANKAAQVAESLQKIDGVELKRAIDI